MPSTYLQIKFSDRNLKALWHFKWIGSQPVNYFQIDNGLVEFTDTYTNIVY